MAPFTRVKFRLAVHPRGSSLDVSRLPVSDPCVRLWQPTNLWHVDQPRWRLNSDAFPAPQAVVVFALDRVAVGVDASRAVIALAAELAGFVAAAAVRQRIATLSLCRGGRGLRRLR